jgi:uncharacterized protein
MNTQQNLQTIQDVYAAFSRGDIPFILDQLTEDVRWITHIESFVPWSGDFSGRGRVPQFFDAIFQTVEVKAFTPQEFVVEGDTVVSQGEFSCVVRATGKSAQTPWIFVWKFRDGRICSYEQFHDPAIADAFR